MANLLIRNVDPALHAVLKARAAEHGRTLEEEARALIRIALSTNRPLNLATLARSIFEPLGGLDLPDMPREKPRDPPDFSGPEYGPPDA